MVVSDVDGGTCFTFTRNVHAIWGDHEVCRGIWSGCIHEVDVRAHYLRRIRDIPGRVGQCHVKDFAIDLRRVQPNCEVAIGTDRTCSDRVALWVFDGNCGTRLTFTRDSSAIGGNTQVGWRIRGSGISRIDVRAYHLRRVRDIAGRIGQCHVEGFAIDLRGTQLNYKVSIGINRTCTHRVALGIFDGNCRARLTFTRHGTAVRGNAQVCRRIRGSGISRIDVRAYHLRRVRHIAGRIGQCHVEGFAIDLRGLQPNCEVAI